MFNFLEFIEEKRKNPEMNLKQTPFSIFKELKKEESWFVSFTHLDKLGINPRSIYETPLGVYCYPLKDYQQQIEQNQTFFNSFPFASDSPDNIINFFLLKPSSSVLEFYLTGVRLNNQELSFEEAKKYISEKCKIFFKKEFVLFEKKIKLFNAAFPKLEDLNKKISWAKNKILTLLEPVLILKSVLPEQIEKKIPKEGKEFFDLINTTSRDLKTYSFSDLDPIFKELKTSCSDLLKKVSDTNEIIFLKTNFELKLNKVYSEFIKDYDSLVRKNSNQFYAFASLLNSFENFNVNATDLVDFKSVSLEEVKQLFARLKKYKLDVFLDEIFKKYEIGSENHSESYFSNESNTFEATPEHFKQIQQINPQAYLIWDITKQLSEKLASADQKRTSVVWNTILRKYLNLDVVVDHGLGLIHPLESKQAVVLDSTKIDQKSLKKMINRDVKPKTSSLKSVDSFSSLQEIFDDQFSNFLSDLSFRAVPLGVTFKTLKQIMIELTEKYLNKNLLRDYEFNFNRVVSDPLFLFEIFKKVNIKAFLKGRSKSSILLLKQQINSFETNSLDSETKKTWHVSLWLGFPRFRNLYEKHFGLDTKYHQLLTAIKNFKE